MVVGKSVPWFKTTCVLGVTYATKKALVKDIRDIINPMLLGEALRPDSPKFKFLMDVLSHHPEWADKSKSGVLAIQARMNTGPGYANKGIWLLRGDGTDIDISWPCAVDASAPSHGRLVRDAARIAIHPQIEGARAAQIGLECTLCGGVLLRDVHVDHKAPATFEYLIQSWLETQAGAPAVKDEGTHSRFADPDTEASWQTFHALFADLRLIHAYENLSMKRLPQ